MNVTKLDGEIQKSCYRLSKDQAWEVKKLFLVGRLLMCGIGYRREQ